MIPELIDSQWGFLAALIIGAGFGFFLEKAGFGRASTLADQFYLRDMRMFKVMFTAILVTLVGVVLFDQLGLWSMRALGESAVSATFIWPALIGGIGVGIGIIISGYCPGTSVVASASGHIDGMMTALGVILGSLIYVEGLPSFTAFHNSGSLGHLFLFDSGIPTPILAFFIVMMALGAFVGAEKIEAWTRRRLDPEAVEQPRSPATRKAQGVILSLGILALGSLAFNGVLKPEVVEHESAAHSISLDDFSHRLMDAPWTMRILDLRAREACAKQRVPGAECVPVEKLKELGLADAPAGAALVLVGEASLKAAPAAAQAYKGEVLTLEGGFKGWARYALKAPAPLSAEATSQERVEYTWRAALNGAMTGRKAAPPPAVPTKKFKPKKKKKGGGCG